MDTPEISLLPNEKAAVSEILLKTLFSREGLAYVEELATRAILSTKRELRNQEVLTI